MEVKADGDIDISNARYEEFNVPKCSCGGVLKPGYFDYMYFDRCGYVRR
jgi:hypothetical protein